MPTFQKFSNFIDFLGKQHHNLDTHQFKVCLTSAAPPPDCAGYGNFEANELPTGNGYIHGGFDIQNSYSVTGGVGMMFAQDVTITAAGGAIGPFRYAVIFSQDDPNNGVLGFADYGSNLTLNDGESLVIDFADPLITLI